MSYIIRKFKKVIKDGTGEDILKFMDLRMEQVNSFYPYELLVDLHDMEYLELFHKKVGFNNLNYTSSTVEYILKKCKFEKGKFLIDSGLPLSILNNSVYDVQDFNFFKYLVDIKFNFNFFSLINYNGDLRKIKYFLDNSTQYQKYDKIFYYSINKIKSQLLIEEYGFSINKKTTTTASGAENINYLFDISKNKSKNFKFEFLKNNSMTPYILKNLYDLNKERVKNFFSVYVYNIHFSVEVCILAYKLGVLGFNLLSDRGYNFLSIYSFKISLLKKLPKDLRKNLLNEKNKNGESFLWYGESLRNCKVKDIEFLIESGLEYDYVNNDGHSFLEFARTDLKIKQYFIDLGVKVNIQKTISFETYGQGLSSFSEYINYAIKNNIRFPLELLEYFVDFEVCIKNKDIIKMFEHDCLGVKKAFLKRYDLFGSLLLNNRKMFCFLIDNIIIDINKPDRRKAYLPCVFSSLFLDRFMNKGFNIDLLLNVKNNMILDNFYVFSSKVKEIKSIKENKKISTMIDSLQNYEKKTKRI